MLDLTGAPETTGDLGRRMTEFVSRLQDTLCAAIEDEDGSARFRSDVWSRPGGGGGHSRVLEGGRVFEKGGVNASAVWGELEETFAKRLQGEGRRFFAAGISLILHPMNPRVPTVHANWRFIEQAGETGAKAWFGGGADLTPHYLFDEDATHFHRVLRDVCERHAPGSYAELKAECDRYFYLPHREETRGIGGIFFENRPRALEDELRFVQDCGRAFVEAYLPLVRRRKTEPWGEREKRWQRIRRGRYVEFNLVYDRGTIFGLQTRGRTESILVSMPPDVAWVYDHHPEPGSEEARLVTVLRNPRSWL